MRIDNHTHLGVDPLFYLQGWSPYCLDIPRLFADSAGSRVDQFIVFPFVSYMDLDQSALRENRIQLSDNPDAVPYRFENRRLQTDLERCPPEWREKLWPFLIADPSRKTEEQVREWRNLPDTYPVKGIKIQGTIIQSKVIALLDQGACILDYAAEKNLPLLIHSSILPEDEWSQCADLLRVAEARPEIRFVLAHSCRYHLESLNRVNELPNTWFDCSAHGIHCQCVTTGLPAVAIPEERFDTDYTSPARVLRDLAETYPDKLIWGTDAPFYSCEYERLQLRSTYQDEVAYLDALPAALQEKVAHRNTLAWLGMEAPQASP